MNVFVPNPGLEYDEFLIYNQTPVFGRTSTEDELLFLTLLEPQPAFGDKLLKFQVVCPQNGTAVLKGLNPRRSY